MRRLWWIMAAVVLAGCATGPDQPTRAAEGRSAQVSVESFSLPSGMKVVLARTPPDPERAPRVYVGSYVPYGTNNEASLGLAHLLEHVVATSPSTVPIPAPPAGAEILASNAVTKPNYTAFIRTVAPAGLEAMIYSRLVRLGGVAEDVASVEREKGRVVTELERSPPRAQAYKALQALATGKPTPIAEEIAAMKAIAPPEVFAAMRAAYGPQHGILVVTGDIEIAATAAMVRQAATRVGLAHRGASQARRFPAARLDFERPPAVLPQASGGTVGVAFRQPPHDSGDYLAFLVLDQLLMGGREGGGDPRDVSRSDTSPLGARLGRKLGASALTDGRENGWGVPAYAEGDPAIYAVIFSVPAAPEPQVAVEAVRSSLQEVRREAMSDAEIRQAAERLGDFYDRWLLEPDYRILSDHLAALAFRGDDPTEVRELSARIRRVSPNAVRRMMDRRLLPQKPLVVVLGGP